MKNKKQQYDWISLQDAAKNSPYSQEYLSLRARSGKLFAKKIGRNWYTTREAMVRYLKEQSIAVIEKPTLDEESILRKIDQIQDSFKNFASEFFDKLKHTQDKPSNEVVKTKKKNDGVGFLVLIIISCLSFFTLGGSLSGGNLGFLLGPLSNLRGQFASLFEIEYPSVPSFTPRIFAVNDTTTPLPEPAPTAPNSEIYLKPQVVEQVIINQTLSSKELKEIASRLNDNQLRLVELTDFSNGLRRDVMAIQSSPPGVVMPPYNPPAFGFISAPVLPISADSTQTKILTVMDSANLQNLNVVGNSYFTSNLEIAGTASISDDLYVFGNIGIGTSSAPNQLTVVGSGSFTGQLKATRNPTLAHTGTWPSFSNASDATLYINPADPVADGNILVYADNGDTKFVVDAEGDIFGSSLILTGSTTTGDTTVAGNFIVEGNALLGDASGDKVRFGGTVLPQTLTSNIFTMQASPSWSGDYYFRTLNSSSTPIFTIASTSAAYFAGNVGIGTTSPAVGSILSVASASATMTLKSTGSTASVSFDLIPANGTSQNKFTLRAGGLSGTAGERLDILNGASTPVALITIASSGSVGIGTTVPSGVLDITKVGTSFTDRFVFNGFGSAGANRGIKFSVSDEGSDGGLAKIQAFRVSDDLVMPLVLNPAGGNVGIGTTAPGTRLEVNDSNHTIGAGWTDYGNLFIATNDAMAADKGGSLAFGGLRNGSGYAAFAKIHGKKSNATNDDADGYLAFEVGNNSQNPYSTERMRILANGNVGIGVTSPSRRLEVRRDGSDSVGVLAVENFNTTDTDNIRNTLFIIGTAATGTASNFVQFLAASGGSEVGKIRLNNNAVAYVTTSDERLKNAAPTTRGLETLRQIGVYDYSWKNDPEARIYQGFLSQQLYQFYPDAVGVGGDDPTIRPWTVEYGRITPLLVESIQELDANLASISFRIDELKARLASQSQESVTVQSSGAGTDVIVSATVDVLGTLADAVMLQVQNLWAKGDIIAEGVKKTYYAVSGITGEVFSAENWGARTIVIAAEASPEIKALFNDVSAQAADQSKVDLAENGQYLATYGVDSTRSEIQLSGSSQLVNGEARVYFDYSFSSVISNITPIKVIVTPTTTVAGQLYVANKTAYGFVVKELNSQSNGTFDWLVIARRQGYEDAVAPSPTPEPESTPTSSVDSSGSSVTPSPTTEPSSEPSESPTPDPEGTSSSTPPDVSSEASATASPTPEPTETPTPTP